MQQIKLLKRGAVSMGRGRGEEKRAETTVVQTNGLITAWVTLHTHVQVQTDPSQHLWKISLGRGAHKANTVCAHRACC